MKRLPGHVAGLLAGQVHDSRSHVRAVAQSASRHDGKTETYAFTEIDRSLSGGAVLDLLIISGYAIPAEDETKPNEKKPSRSSPTPRSRRTVRMRKT